MSLSSRVLHQQQIVRESQAADRLRQWTPVPKFLTKHRVTQQRKDKLLVGRLQPLASSFADSLPLYGGLTASVGVLGFVGWRAYLYFQMEFITASMIGNHVPKGGAQVLQIGGGTREFYYYPKGTIQISVTQSSTNKGVLENGGIAAKIPVTVRDSVDLNTTERFNLGSSEAYDAVVLLDRFSKIQNTDTFLKEVKVSLKPNGKFIFIEKDDSILKQLNEGSLFGDVQSDIALEGQDDHIVGVASKANNKAPKKQTTTGFAES